MLCSYCIKNGKKRKAEWFGVNAPDGMKDLCDECFSDLREQRKTKYTGKQSVVGGVRNALKQTPADEARQLTLI
jgi:hypothetical protein